MSADNGVYILQSKDGFRVTHAQAIENIYWQYTCCDNPDVVEIDTEDIYYHERCLNCGQEDSSGKMTNKINPKFLKMYFGDSKIFATSEEAMNEAVRIYEEIIADDFGICEYGIQYIRGFEKEEFPNG
jgi:hypothetical protein